MVAIINELGYGGTRIAIKNGQAPELQRLKREIAARREAPTVPLDVPVKESKGNGAVEKVLLTWQGQFRTLRDHLEFMMDTPFGPRHPVLTWCAWWAGLLLNRVRSFARAALTKPRANIYEHQRKHHNINDKLRK